MDNGYQEERDFIQKLLDETEVQYEEYKRTKMQKEQKKAKEKRDESEQ